MSHTYEIEMGDDHSKQHTAFQLMKLLGNANEAELTKQSDMVPGRHPLLSQWLQQQAQENHGVSSLQQQHQGAKPPQQNLQIAQAGPFHALGQEQEWAGQNPFSQVQQELKRQLLLQQTGVGGAVANEPHWMERPQASSLGSQPQLSHSAVGGLGTESSLSSKYSSAESYSPLMQSCGMKIGIARLSRPKVQNNVHSEREASESPSSQHQQQALKQAEDKMSEQPEGGGSIIGPGESESKTQHELDMQLWREHQKRALDRASTVTLQELAAHIREVGALSGSNDDECECSSGEIDTHDTSMSVELLMDRLMKTEIAKELNPEVLPSLLAASLRAQALALHGGSAHGLQSQKSRDNREVATADEICDSPSPSSIEAEDLPAELLLKDEIKSELKPEEMPVGKSRVIEQQAEEDASAGNELTSVTEADISGAWHVLAKAQSMAVGEAVTPEDLAQRALQGAASNVDMPLLPDNLFRLDSIFRTESFNIADLLVDNLEDAEVDTQGMLGEELLSSGAELGAEPPKYLEVDASIEAREQIAQESWPSDWDYNLPDLAEPRFLSKNAGSSGGEVGGKSSFGTASGPGGSVTAVSPNKLGDQEAGTERPGPLATWPQWSISPAPQKGVQGGSYLRANSEDAKEWQNARARLRSERSLETTGEPPEAINRGQSVPHKKARGQLRDSHDLGGRPVTELVSPSNEIDSNSQPSGRWRTLGSSPAPPGDLSHQPKRSSPGTSTPSSQGAKWGGQEVELVQATFRRCQELQKIVGDAELAASGNSQKGQPGSPDAYLLANQMRRQKMNQRMESLMESFSTASSYDQTSIMEEMTSYLRILQNELQEL